MRFEIDEATVRRTQKCEKEFVCLKGEGGLYCKVTDIMTGTGREAALVECPGFFLCAYRESYGETDICECPVRIEIARKYGK